MKHSIIHILAFVVMAFADDYVHCSMGSFVNSEYMVTAYHVIEGFENICYYDIKNDTCHQAHLVDYTVNSDVAVLKLDEKPLEMPMVCRLAHSELPIGEKLIKSGFSLYSKSDIPTI